MDEKKKRSKFSSKLGFVLSAAGSAVGLGNIWRFPYLAARYGGGIFLLVYLVLVLTFGYTMIIAESAIGRMTRKSPDQCGHSDSHCTLLFRNRRLGIKVPLCLCSRRGNGGSNRRIFYRLYRKRDADRVLVYCFYALSYAHHLYGCGKWN